MGIISILQKNVGNIFWNLDLNLEPYSEQFLETIRKGRRKQDGLLPNEYRYYKQFNELNPDNNHLVVIVIFKTSLNEHGKYTSNNFVVTGWAKFIQPKR